MEHLYYPGETYSRIKLVNDNWCISVLVSSQSNGSCIWGFISCRGKGCIVHKLKMIIKEKKKKDNQRLTLSARNKLC